MLYDANTRLPIIYQGKPERNLPIKRLAGLDMPYYLLREAVRLYMNDSLVTQVTDADIIAIVEKIHAMRPGRDIGAYTDTVKHSIADTVDNMLFLIEQYKQKRGGVFGGLDRSAD